MAKGGQQGGGSSYGWGGQASPWMGMASQWGGQGGGYGAPYGAQPPTAYAQGGALSGADPTGASAGAYPTYMGPPRDQPLGAPPAPPTGGPTGVTGSIAAPGQAATPGLLGGAVDASGAPMQSNVAAPAQNGQGALQSLFQGWHNRGYGVPTQAGQAGQAGGNMQPPQQGVPQGAPQGGPQYQMPPQIQSILQGLFGGWGGQGGGGTAPTGYM